MLHPLDWTIVAAYLVWIVWDGLRRTRHSRGPSNLRRSSAMTSAPAAPTAPASVGVKKPE